MSGAVTRGMGAGGATAAWTSGGSCWCSHGLPVDCGFLQVSRVLPHTYQLKSNDPSNVRAVIKWWYNRSMTEKWIGPDALIQRSGPSERSVINGGRKNNNALARMNMKDKYEEQIL